VPVTTTPTPSEEAAAQPAPPATTEEPATATPPSAGEAAPAMPTVPSTGQDDDEVERQTTGGTPAPVPSGG